MTIARTHLAGWTAALTLGLAACNKEPAPEPTSQQDETEAAVMADDAVGLAEAALENVAMSDDPAGAVPVQGEATSAASVEDTEADANVARTN